MNEEKYVFSLPFVLMKFVYVQICSVCNYFTSIVLFYLVSSLFSFPFVIFSVFSTIFSDEEGDKMLWVSRMR